MFPFEWKAKISWLHKRGKKQLYTKTIKIYDRVEFYFIIIIIVMYWQDIFPWLFLDIHPYQPLLLIGSLDDTQCPYRTNECKFLLFN